MGFPIRQSPDHSSVANSPGLFAGSYGLLRLLMPRHPPCALSSLSLQRDLTLMLASTMKFSRYGRNPSHWVAACSRTRALAPAGESFGGRMVQRACRPARSLRTQQRARHSGPSLGGSTLAAPGVLTEIVRHECQLVDVPLVSIVASRRTLEQRRLDGPGGRQHAP